MVRIEELLDRIMRPILGTPGALGRRSPFPAVQLQRYLPLAAWQGVGPLLPQGEGGGAEDPGLDVLLCVVVLDVMLDGSPDLLLFEEPAGDGDVRRHVAVLVPGRHHASHHLVNLGGKRGGERGIL